MIKGGGVVSICLIYIFLLDCEQNLVMGEGVVDNNP